MTLAEIKDTARLFEFYKSLGEKTFEQLNDEQLFFQANGESNSVAIIVNHLWGNMLSRWTNFLNEDGEKEWRNRDAEFESKISSRKVLIERWDAGWHCLFDALEKLEENDLDRLIRIRNQEHTIFEAIQRQLGHYAYHIGQIVFIGKLLTDQNWKSLSIPRGNSVDYNKEKFERPINQDSFTEEFTKKKK